jgi:hypothetical protein
MARAAAGGTAMSAVGTTKLRYYYYRAGLKRPAPFNKTTDRLPSEVYLKLLLTRSVLARVDAPCFLR